ncbi:hypothetical protein SLEP1_g57202 [Rubroshorea leprosula]|uniref:Receptor-like serine/threonine-protein kinase n=1 Tax=Rubroshorea leprosula TaxID=152421 RepID=A0AAV5MNC6_9ROSI|nr:hypothetical protein SLEP1_g57202 [Rubroshorea leprosula]
MSRGMISQVFLLLFSSCLQFGSSADTITPSKSIKYPESIVSNGSKFQLGFFSPANSTDLYVGIWYNGIDPVKGVIWVANREKPLKDSSGTMMISEDGNLVVVNGQKEVLWSSNVEKLKGYNTIARLLDLGNVVLLDKTTDMKMWESFQQPSNVLMPTMKLGVDLRTGKKIQGTSWKSPTDPSVGNFSVGIEPSGVPQTFVWKNSQPYWRSGQWNGEVFVGIEYMTYSDLRMFSLDIDQGKTFYLSYTTSPDKFLLDFFMDPEGKIIERLWNWTDYWEDTKILWSNVQNECDVYGKCGPFGSCDSQNPTICSCLRGFEPKNREEWNRGIWTGGCIRSTTLQCNRKNSGREVGKEDGFLKLEMMKVPDFAQRWPSNTEDECRNRCLNCCSCIACAYDVSIGCMSWNGTLIDIQKFSGGGMDLYIRLAYSELEQKKDVKLKIIITTVIVGTIIFCICTLFIRGWIVPKGKAWKEKTEEMLFGRRKTSTSEVKLQELPLLKFEELATATKTFNLANQLGQGGFGPVYRGTLQNGQEIAVKRLSSTSGQGLEEFLNEVFVISKLQHRNLVRLLGCCVEQEEKILVYEFMPNKSLDTYLFDPIRKEFLDWRKRFNIIEGISRGLLYLHSDSRLRIIHRDLKASNILLDEELNPKISDFGMARIFRGDNENEANTRRVVGTYGYMSPEYAMVGLFSEKSDIFSYGVLLLEIVSGRRNTSFGNDEDTSSLLEYAWKLWNEDNVLAMVDKLVCDPCHRREILRCIHVGLLCVQEMAKDRPTMSTVISMLNSEIVDLPSPKQPAFILKQIMTNVEFSYQHGQQRCSINNVTITNVQGR